MAGETMVSGRPWAVSAYGASAHVWHSTTALECCPPKYAWWDGRAPLEAVVGPGGDRKVTNDERQDEARVEEWSKRREQREQRLRERGFDEVTDEQRAANLATTLLYLGGGTDDR